MFAQVDFEIFFLELEFRPWSQHKMDFLRKQLIEDTIVKRTRVSESWGHPPGNAALSCGSIVLFNLSPFILLRQGLLQPRMAMHLLCD